MRRNDVVEVTLEVLEQHGIKGVVEDRGKHCAVTFNLPDGREKHIICAVSPSDGRRAVLNARGFARRLMRQENVPLPPPKPVTSLAHALSLPKQTDTGPNRLAILEMDFVAILDLVTDVQQENAVLAQRVQELQERLSRPLVLSATFAELTAVAPPVPVPADLPKAVLPFVRPPRKKEEGPRKKYGITREQVLEAFRVPGKWTQVSDVRKAAGYGEDAGSQQACAAMLSNLKKLELVESGQRGYWRRPVAPVVVEEREAS